MGKKNQLGMFWGSETLYFAESTATECKKLFHCSFESIVKSQIPPEKNSLHPWEKDLADNIKRTLSKQKVSASEINLSLPTKDIIFRSFVIPWMQPGDIQNVVSFEVGKYIPFSLDKLSYSYYPITITEKGKKLIHIIFVAIKNSSLDSYMRILKAASLQVNIIEPAASSLIRALSFKSFLPKGKTVALIEKEDIGRIIIVDDNIPQFVREFHISPSSPEEVIADPDSDVKKLTKEVRISLDYFNRQNEQLRVENIFFLASPKDEKLPENLEKYVDLPVTGINESSVLESTPQSGVGSVNAYGASIIASLDSSILFDLSGKKTEAFQSKKSIGAIPQQYKHSLKTALICVPIIVVSFAAIIIWTQNLRWQISSFNKKLGAFQDSDISFIKEKHSLLKTKLKSYRSIRTKSDVARFLLIIPKLLPVGAWLGTLDITYDDSATFNDPNVVSRRKSRSKNTGNTESQPTLTMTVDGYAYSENRNRQFRIVNEFLSNIKKDSELSSFFQNIELEKTSAQKLDDHNVTYFTIVCRQNNEN